MHEAGVIALEEYVPKLLAREALSDAVGAQLWQCYKNEVAVDFPSPKTGGLFRNCVSNSLISNCIVTITCRVPKYFDHLGAGNDTSN